jgi:hypothetical protein
MKKNMRIISLIVMLAMFSLFVLGSGDSSSSGSGKYTMYKKPDGTITWGQNY